MRENKEVLRSLNASLRDLNTAYSCINKYKRGINDLLMPLVTFAIDLKTSGNRAINVFSFAFSYALLQRTLQIDLSIEISETNNTWSVGALPARAGIGTRIAVEHKDYLLAKLHVTDILLVQSFTAKQ